MVTPADRDSLTQEPCRTSSRAEALFGDGHRLPALPHLPTPRPAEAGEAVPPSSTPRNHATSSRRPHHHPEQQTQGRNSTQPILSPL